MFAQNHITDLCLPAKMGACFLDFFACGVQTWLVAGLRSMEGNNRPEWVLSTITGGQDFNKSGEVHRKSAE